MNEQVVQLLEEALEKAKRGKTIGIGIIEVVRVGEGVTDWALDTRYWGPLLCLLAGTSQLAHAVNEKSKPIST